MPNVPRAKAHALTEFAQIPVPKTLQSLTSVGIEKTGLKEWVHKQERPTDAMCTFMRATATLKDGEGSAGEVDAAFWEAVKALYKEEVGNALLPPESKTPIFGSGVRQRPSMVTFKSHLEWEREAGPYVVAKGPWTGKDVLK
jgi:hypothetical protein